MSLKKVEVEVSEATHDFVSALVDLASVVKTQLDDGFQVGDDLVALGSAVVVLKDRLAKVSSLGDDMSASPAAFAMALLVAAAPLADLAKGEEPKEEASE